jgi:N-acetylmuramoyl-L-alanine amidase
VLTENFFYDNEDDCKFMLSDEGKDAIVELHVRSILEYIAKNEK